MPLDHIEQNPEQPRLAMSRRRSTSSRHRSVSTASCNRSSSGPVGPDTYQLIAGERRWRASKQAGLDSIPALIEEIDDDTALEISIIENLQREDISPLDEASMFDRMVSEHGYSIRKLADKLGKDKGYVENRLRLADAPDEVRELVSLRKDTLSHAYELMKVEDPKKRRRLADQVARGELTLIKLRDKIEGRRRQPRLDEGNGTEPVIFAIEVDSVQVEDEPIEDEVVVEAPPVLTMDRPLTEDSLVNAKASLADALDELVGVLRAPEDHPVDRRRRPRQPRQVPHDLEAPTRERDRARQIGQQHRLGSGSETEATTDTQPVAAIAAPIALELPGPAPRRFSATAERDPEPEHDDPGEHEHISLKPSLRSISLNLRTAAATLVLSLPSANVGSIVIVRAGFLARACSCTLPSPSTIRIPTPSRFSPRNTFACTVAATLIAT